MERKQRLPRPGRAMLAWSLLLLLVPAADPVSAADSVLQPLLEQAQAARWRSPAEARALNVALRERLRVQPDAVIEAEVWLNDCWSQIENDGKRAVAAVQNGVRRLDEAKAKEPALRLRLAVCDHTAREYLGELSESLAGYDRLVAQAVKLEDPELEADARLARGELRSYVGRFADGLEDLGMARRVYEEHGRADQSLYALQSIAVLYYRLKDYDRAIDYLQQVIPERARRGQTYMLADATFNLARSLEGKGDTDGAMARYQAVLVLYQKLGSETNIAYTRHAIGNLLVSRNQAQPALELLDSALATFRGLEDPDMTARVLESRARALYMLGHAQEAIEALRESVGLYQKLDHRPGLEMTYRLLGTVFFETGQFKSAAQAMIDERAVHEQLDNSRHDELLSHLRAQFDAEKKDQENRYLQTQHALAESALEDAARIGRLKTLVIALAVLLLAVAALFLARQLRLARRLRVLALVDELTGIANRRNVLAFLDEQIRLHRADDKPLSVILLDIDHFKRLNDTYGHAAGDEALKAVAGLCQQLMRGHDRIGRTGGEEFLAVLPEASLAHAGEVAERLCEQLRKLPLDHITPGLRTSVSIGVSEWRSQDADTQAQAVVKRADVALYQAKQGGRDRVCLAAR